MNNVILIGRITAKPELQYTPNSQMAVTKFTIAVDRPSKDGEKKADFIRVTAFGRRAETICRYMDKGRQIAVQGKLQTGSHKDRDGKTVYTTDVIIDNDEFLGNASDNREQVAKNIEQRASEWLGLGDSFDSTSDGIPF